MDPNDPRLRKWGIALGVLVALLALVDSIALKGETVATASISLKADSAPSVIEVTRPYQEHLVRIATRKHSNNETRGRSIAWRLVGPDGATVAEESEIVARKRRYFEFFPMEAGAYELHVHETTLLGGGRGSASVAVTVGDRRILGPLLGF